MIFNSESRIPLELYPLIIGYIDDKATLLSILATSKVIYPDAERQLYSCVGFYAHNEDKHILFLSSVLNNNRAHLSGLVYRYCYAAGQLTSSMALDLMKQALPTFTNLKQLKLVICGETASLVLPLNNPPFQLEIFYWSLMEGARDDPRVFHFLATQHSLQTLLLYRAKPQPSQISLDNLRQLNDIACAPSALLSIVPHSNSVRRLCWLSTLSPIPNISALLKSLRVLTFPSYTPLSIVSDIAGQFQTLEVLGLYSVPEYELSSLYHIPLHSLVFERVVDGPGVAKKVFRNMKSLQHMFFPAVGSTNWGTHSVLYSRWDRGGEIGILVSGDAVETNWWCRRW